MDTTSFDPSSGITGVELSSLLGFPSRPYSTPVLLYLVPLFSPDGLMWWQRQRHPVEWGHSIVLWGSGAGDLNASCAR